MAEYGNGSFSTWNLKQNVKLKIKRKCLVKNKRQTITFGHWVIRIHYANLLFLSRRKNCGIIFSRCANVAVVHYLPEFQRGQCLLLIRLFIRNVQKHYDFCIARESRLKYTGQSRFAVRRLRLVWNGQNDLWQGRQRLVDVICLHLLDSIGRLLEALRSRQVHQVASTCNSKIKILNVNKILMLRYYCCK